LSSKAHKAHVKGTAGSLLIRHLPSQAYDLSWRAMQDFTQQRDETSLDEIWLLQHLPVFTQGQAGKAEHLLNAGSIPVVQSDRGGQITYHGPGQLIVYLLLDLRRLGFGVRALVTHMEEALINCLERFDIAAQAKAKAPGVYVGDSKIASLGLRVRKGCSLHGLALNVDMDLAPFARINPCGYSNLNMVQMSDYSSAVNFDQVAKVLSQCLVEQLPYSNISHTQHAWVSNNL